MARKTEYRVYVTPEKWDKVNEINKDLVNEFLSYLRTIDRSPQTIITYESDLKIFFIWFMENCKNKSFAEIKKKDIMRFQDWALNLMKLSSNRIRHLRSSVSSLSNFIENVLDEEEEWEDFKNIVNKIPAPTKVDVREKTVLSVEQVEEILKVLVEKKDYQKACFFACLANSGVRRAEIVQFKESFFVDENIIYGMYKTPKIRCKGKGTLGKQLNKFVIAKPVKPYLELWFAERKRLGINVDNLFVTWRKGVWQPISVSTVGEWCEQLGEIVGEHIYPHSLRHYLATTLTKEGIELSKIKTILGHESVATSEIYVDIDEEENLQGLFEE